ncbi:hypothetical protein [Geopseudomonas aromaticivorans]
MLNGSALWHPCWREHRNQGIEPHHGQLKSWKAEHGAEVIEGWPCRLKTDVGQ